MAIIGKTDLDVFRLGLGGIPFMNLSFHQACEVISAAVDGGINFADTAEGYGDSEEKLGFALKPKRDQFIIATKSPTTDGQAMRKAIDQSLARLGTDYIDIYQIQTLTSLPAVLAPSGALEALQDAKRAGKIRYIGVTGHRASVLVDAIKTGQFDTVQAPINIVDRESEQELLPLAKELGLGVLGMKPICGGTLDNPVLGLKFCLNSIADVIFCGMKSVAEVEENLATVNSFKPLTALEEDELLAEASQLGKQFCRRCEYCLPCPEGLIIPKILWLANYKHRYPEREIWTEDEYVYLDKLATDCLECGECEEKCPYDLPIRQMLRDAHVELSPTPKQVMKRRFNKVVRRFRG